jgi:L-ascorbate metabolism protein UlaG (beta-lactamase superfamily)
VDFMPDVVTMNNAHNTHWTASPDPAIPHVLEGWANANGVRDHYLDLGDMLVRNVHTDTRAEGGRSRDNGNSIFVFEAAGLCIGHLGHLHQEPSAAQYAALGRMDVVMAAVDGGLTLDHTTLVRVLDRLRSSVVIPMHWFGRNTLDRFLADMRGSGYAVDERTDSGLTLSLSDLPPVRTVIVLEPRFLSDQ